MNALQGIDRGERRLFVTLNPPRQPRPRTHLRPLHLRPSRSIDAAAIAAQKDLHEIQGRNGVWFCGAWTGYGFHEDGSAPASLWPRRWAGPCRGAQVAVPATRRRCWRRRNERSAGDISRRRRDAASIYSGAVMHARLKPRRASLLL